MGALLPTPPRYPGQPSRPPGFADLYPNVFIVLFMAGVITLPALMVWLTFTWGVYP